MADFAGAVSGRMVSPGDSAAPQDRQDRYVRFLRLDPQNRNIFTSQRKGSFDTKKDALVSACRVWVCQSQVSDSRSASQDLIHEFAYDENREETHADARQ